MKTMTASWTLVTLAVTALGACAAPASGDATDETDGPVTNEREEMRCLTCTPPPPPTSTAPRPAPPSRLPAPTGCGNLQAGQGLYESMSISACGGGFFLADQGDSNVVLYNATNGVPLWATFPSGSEHHFDIESNGNLVEIGTAGQIQWQSGTTNTGANNLRVQDDGNLVLGGPSGVAWNTGTSGTKSTCGIIGGCNNKDASTPAIWNACESLTTNLETVITGLPIPSLSLVSSNVCGGYVYASYADSQDLPTTIWVENSGGQRFGQRYTSGRDHTSALWDLAGQNAVRACVSQDNNPLAQFPLCTSWSAIAHH